MRNVIYVICFIVSISISVSMIYMCLNLIAFILEHRDNNPIEVFTSKPVRDFLNAILVLAILVVTMALYLKETEEL